ncbi:hypothetical protein [Petrachloros mirabilis]
MPMQSYETQDGPDYSTTVGAFPVPGGAAVGTRGHKPLVLG